ncbi:MAG TPA: helix-turn-helix domain-containing protein [Methylocystis sp.]|jgi:predicted site-specific integrase-resolvase
MQAQNAGLKVSLLTSKEVAARLRVSPQTLAKWRVNGEGPTFLKVGFRVFYDEAVVADWLAKRERCSTSHVEAA